MIWIRTVEGNLVCAGVIHQAICQDAKDTFQLLTVVKDEWYPLATKLTADQVRLLLEAANRAIRAKQPLVDFCETLQAMAQGGTAISVG
jgi:hypothetical protein